MGAEIVEVLGDLLTCKVTGRLSEQELAVVQNEVTAIIRQHDSVRILIITEDFEGWERGKEWDDFTFLSENDGKIERMAIVGEKKWEELTGAFVAKDLRAFPIEYFLPTDVGAALRWLGRTSDSP
jgi:hypothetical protein